MDYVEWFSNICLNDLLYFCQDKYWLYLHQDLGVNKWLHPRKRWNVITEKYHTFNGSSWGPAVKCSCRPLPFRFRFLSTFWFWFVNVSACRRFGLPTFWFVDVSVCQRFRLKTFWLTTFRFVDVLTSNQKNHCSSWTKAGFFPISIHFFNMMIINVAWFGISFAQYTLRCR